MAIESVCGRLIKDLDAACEAPVRKYWQQAVLINKSDIESSTVTFPDYDSEPATCNYNVEFTLKCETKGIRVTGIESGDNFKGLYSKSRDDNGYPTYKHQVQVFISGTSEDVKCALDAIDKGSVVVAMQLKDGTVEIYGFENGLSTGDYDYDIQENGGGTAIMLESLDNAPENHLPLVYVSGSPGDEGIDFDDAFAGVTPCP